jgi:serine protease Do
MARFKHYVAFLLCCSVLFIHGTGNHHHIKAALPDFSSLAKRLLPTVVSILVTGPSQMDTRPSFDFFFQPNPLDRGQGRMASSQGSGVIIDASGYIVTNHHVIEHGTDITVVLHDGTKLPAKLMGSDPKTDLALLKVSSKQPLPTASWGDSDTAEVGNWVLAIGSPFTLNSTVTAGIISARSREIGDHVYNDYIQTDAAINPGNSGGPMFNMAGEVIGINKMIYSNSGGSIGLGFSIPSNSAKPIIADLKSYGKTKRGWLGISIQKVTKPFADSVGLKGAYGVLVNEVAPGSPADKAGIRQYDVIIAYNHKKIKNIREVPRMVGQTAAGSTVPIVIWRANKTIELQAKIAELDLAAYHKNPHHPQSLSKKDTTYIQSMGFYVIDIKTKKEDTAKDEGQKPPIPQSPFTRKPSQHNIQIAHIEDGSLAQKAGFRVGDYIIALNQYHIETIQDLQKIVKKQKLLDRQYMTFFIERDGYTMQMIIEMRTHRK